MNCLTEHGYMILVLRSTMLFLGSALSVFYLPISLQKTLPQAQSPRKSLVASGDPFTADLVPTLSKAGARWKLTFRAGEDLRWLQNVVKAGREPARVPVSLQPGRWLSGTLRPNGQSGVVEVALEEADILGLLPGWNTLTIQAPGWHLLTRRFDAAPLFRADADLRAYAEVRLRSVPLPPVTPSSQTISAPLETANELTLPGIPGLWFAPLNGKSITLSRDHPAVTIPTGGKTRKVYLLLLARLPSSTATSVARLTALLPDSTLMSRELRARVDFQNADIALPSGEPLRVAEFDLGELRDMEALRIEMTDPRASLDIVGMSALGGVKPGGFAGLPLRIQKQVTGGAVPLFTFDQPTLAGWEVQGSGWGTTDTVGEFFGRRGLSRYFADSKVVGGEPATGTILSPPFVLLTNHVSFLANGHGMKNYYALVDVADGKELLRSPVPEKTGPFEKITWDVTSFKGRRVRFKAVDGDDRTAYAWLAFDDIELVP